MSIGFSLRPVFLVVLFLAVTAVRAADPSDDVFDLDRLQVKITAQLPYIEIPQGPDKILVMRHQDPGHVIEPPYDRTSRDCPPFCVQPMTLARGVETIGELELIEFLRQAADGDDSVLVIDSRTAEWTTRGTIPGAVNIPYTRLDPKHTSAKEIAETLELEMGVIRSDDVWNFSAAKTLVLFCNGAWCGQSPTNIKALLNLGYPPHKLKWYRGGLQSWEQLGLTTVKPAE